MGRLAATWVSPYHQDPAPGNGYAEGFRTGEQAQAVTQPVRHREPEDLGPSEDAGWTKPRSSTVLRTRRPRARAGGSRLATAAHELDSSRRARLLRLATTYPPATRNGIAARAAAAHRRLETGPRLPATQAPTARMTKTAKLDNAPATRITNRPVSSGRLGGGAVRIPMWPTTRPRPAAWWTGRCRPG